MKKYLISMAVVAVISGCVSVSKEHRLSPSFQSLEFNSLLSEYKARPTFVSLLEMSDGEEVLNIKMDSYLASSDGIKPSISISRKYVDENIEAIEKYLKWNKLALDRKDQFTKEIAITKSWDNAGVTVENRYTFHSGNEFNHYLEIVTCSLSICNPSQKSPIMLNSNGATELVKELYDFRTGSVSKTNVDSVYN
ncbi:hypothetical protein M2G95_19770 [Vibrio vulnificus]|uniref:hypothetical protein n=1 Tax=Vibrio vulnificus TaxID=672 RepID=UPI001A2BCB8E|nr:hypothetical protein [Vibrio vulnificus]EHK5112028.1 hypothetical protein [Vibrio parahaemolyticus]EHU5198704.1 hypothetical protein [Vibrio vulnificus]MCU8124629.1 hypothetical protein [Vibrio vulnificus]MCU8304208.1 hypothetical protein [Vibrio vulnificus]MDK2640197.1 hypothetical protein [Vibrio vulnificus]